MKNIYLSFILIFLFITGCEKIPDSIIDNNDTSIQAVQINAPAEFHLSIFDSLITTFVEFNEGVNIKSVWVNLYSPKDEKVNPDPLFLRDDGVFSNGDAQKGDNKYSCNIKLGRDNMSGVYHLKYYATDTYDNEFELGSHKLLFRSTDVNNPPQVSELSAPDSLDLKLIKDGEVLTVPLSIKVTDPEGLNDVKIVFLNSYRPNGEPSKANPIFLFDDGEKDNSGDATAGDGIYTRIIRMPADTEQGTYKFEFQALDQFDSFSNKIIHEVVVYK